MPTKKGELPIFVNLSDLNEKRKLLAHIGQLQGNYSVTLQPRKLQRSLNQNSFYWGCTVQPFRDYLRREYGDPLITIDDAHEILKDTLLPKRQLVNQNTGEVKEIPPSSAALDITKFSAYLERVIKFLAEYAGIVVTEPIPAEKKVEVDERPVDEVPI